ncbi:MAG: ABC transporter permease [Caulobacteraceae bacterium]|nr:ABC transporter permease [Caulobacteraceae bacterium]
MSSPAAFNVQQSDTGRVAQLSGDWTAVGLGHAGQRLREALRGVERFTLDVSGIGRCDTAGVLAILRASDGRIDPATWASSPKLERLAGLVSNAVRPVSVAPRGSRSIEELLDRVGRGLVQAGIDAYHTMAFVGRLLVVVGRVARDPRRIRWAACVSLAERAGLDAIPIVMVTTFFIGAVVGFLGADELSRFGAQVFAVELISIAVMREFNVVITAVLLAGRSASSFAAEIGSMKMNQEIDAMQTMGVDPFEALVLPRFAALLITMPLLTFMATLAGLAGGILISWWVLGLSPDFFIQRMLDNVSPNHFWVALSKVPVMAAVIAGIGCRQGMEVGGDVQSLGSRVTAAVVHAIFSIILIDAVFALVYMKLQV